MQFLPQRPDNPTARSPATLDPSSVLSRKGNARFVDVIVVVVFTVGLFFESLSQVHDGKTICSLKIESGERKYKVNCIRKTFK